MSEQAFIIAEGQAGSTLAAVLRLQLPSHSWSQVRRAIEGRRVRVAGELCLDPARRLRAGEAVELLDRPAARSRSFDPLVIRYADPHIVVVEKPAGVSTVRHPTERDWSARRKALHPTLEDLLPRLIADREGARRKGPLPRLRIVQRLDKETSGLVIFARSVLAERELGLQFREHTVTRRYLAIIPGHVRPQRIATRLVRDRGDGRRGSTDLPGVGKDAITHVAVVERVGDYALVACHLETGRTHQIRIHLAELGHPICGEKVYNRGVNGVVRNDSSGAPRLALHAAELGILHPLSRARLHWMMALPADLKAFVDHLRSTRIRPDFAKGKQRTDRNRRAGKRPARGDQP
jgi:23S rRNA pseudouridine1911/1915/1917 synthase